MVAETAWVKAPATGGGLDHLGVQAPCINIYQQLLPGITNVTERARYYSFYPWFLWRFEQRFPERDVELLTTYFRRADCLFTLTAENHGQDEGEPNNSKHGLGMVGRNTLVTRAGMAGALAQLRAGGTVRLSEYATLEASPHRYFKNRFGGLGQYYFGVLYELGLLGGSLGSGARYTYEIGEPVARALDNGVPGDVFFDALEGDAIELATLRGLADFCPCRLVTSSREHETLSDLFFGDLRTDSEARVQRRRTLGLLLELGEQLAEQDAPLTPETFRGCLYTGFLPDGRPFGPSSQFQETAAAWAVYQRNDLFSVALQGLFAVCLRLLEQQEGRFHRSRDFSDWLGDSPVLQEALGDEADASWAELVRDAGRATPDIKDWTSRGHEVQEVAGIVGALSRSDLDDAEVLRYSMNVLVTLARRLDDTDPYAPIAFPSDYFNAYPANLRSFRTHSETTWRGFSLRQVTCWLAESWGLELHFRVALRKLRGQSLDTFKVLPTDHGLAVTRVPATSYTTPRFRQAQQILADLGALEITDAGIATLTSIGEAYLERARE